MPLPPLPPGFQLSGGSAPGADLLQPLFGLGVVPTNGYRTQGDIQRLQAEGYHPAANTLHLDGDAVDLVPGKSGLSLGDLQARAAALASRYPGGRALNEGDHVHIQIPGWGMAPGTPGTPNSGLPPLPPGAKLQQRGSLLPSQGGMFASPQAALSASTALTPVTLTGQAHDGDTVRLTSGRNGRLFGADAFELAQQGRNASGQLVPLGQQARDFMLSRIGSGMQGFPTGAQTYGRPVINLSRDPMTDPAHDLLRLGYGMAEPQYLQGTPQFGPYMEAERLARLNRLNGFQTNAETPSQFRHGDGPFQSGQPGAYGDPNSEAVFFDEPSPAQGLRPEIAKGYLSIWDDMKSKPEDLLAYANANGFSIDPAQTRAAYAKRNKLGMATNEITYAQPPRLLTDPGDGRFGTTVRGFADPFNLLDELGGVADTLGVSPGRENLFNSDRRFGDILANNIEQNRSILAHDEATHPNYRLGGQLASGLAVPAFGAETIPGMMVLGGIEGGVSGFGAGEGGFTQRLPGAALGTIGGTVAGATLAPALNVFGRRVVAPLVGKAIDAYSTSPFVNRAAIRARLQEVARDTSGSTPRGPMYPPQPPRDPNSRVLGEFDPAALGQSEGTSYAAMAADHGPELVGPAPRQPDVIDVHSVPPLPPGFKLDVSPSAAQRVASVSDIAPETVIQPLDNGVSTLEESLKANPSRFQDMQAPDETQALGVRTVTTPTGGKVRIRGPLDLTQSLRLMGGVKDFNGELAHMGITNAPRRMPFGSNEQFLGKLVNNEDGIPLEQAAHTLWEEGYLPEFHEPPTTDDLAQLLRNEQFGDRRFHPDDLAEAADFHQAQAQRFAIEEAAANGTPRAEDTSEPVSLDDMLARTAPTYAYEAPTGGKIGNLDFSKIEGGADLAGVMQQIENALGDHPVQASVANDQTKAAAHELGMSVQDFLNTQPGQFDAKRIIAGRMLLHGALEATRRAAQKVVNGGTADDKLAFERAKFVTALIQDHMKGATAEIGRTLQALKIVSTKNDARLAAVRQAIGARGGHNRIEDSAQEFLDLSGDPAKANRFIAKDTKASALQMFNEAVTMARLTNPVTHARNILGNALSTAVSFPETAVEAGLGKLLGSEDRSYLSEVGARAKGIAGAVPDAMRNMFSVLRTGEPIDSVTKVEANMNYRAIPGKVGEIVRLPGNAMTAADEAWKTLIYADHINALARRQALRSGLTGEARNALETQLRNSPTPEMLDSAKIEARYRTFQQELGTWGKQLQNIANTWPGAKILLTFVRTPINLVKFAGERSVFGLAMPSVIRKLVAGGRARDEALSRIIVGSTISTAATLAALRGRVSGNGPDDPRQKAALMQTGWRPNSIRIGDKWVSFQGLDPVSTLVAVAADFAEAGQWATPQERQSIATNLALSAAESASNRTWMSGVADFFDALHDPKHNAAPFFRRQVAGLVPSGLGQATAYTDPYLRSAKTTLQAVRARVPFLSNSLPVQRDVWGDPIRRDQAIGPDIVSPFRYGQVTHDPLSNELVRLGVPLEKPQQFITDENGQRVQLSPQQYDDFVQLAGHPAKLAIAQEMASPQWRQMSDDDKRAEVKSILSDMRDAARDELRDRYPELSGGAPASPHPSTSPVLPPLPSGFQLAQ